MFKLWPMMLIFVLAACGPRVSYELLAPETEEGRACANQCLNALQACESACQRDQQTCEMLNWSMRTLRNDMFDDDCEPSLCISRCAEKHRLCHSNCGGQVIRHTTP